MKDSGVEWIGEIPDEWSIRRIKNLFFVISGATPSSNADNWDGEIIWITPADYKTNDKYIAQGKRNLSVVGYNNCSTSLVPVGSLIFSKRAPIGTVAMNAVPLCTNQGCLSCVKKNEEIDTTYYYYVLSVGTEHFELMGSGTTFKEISASTFSNCSLPFPEVADQRRIADYLDAKCAEIDKVVEKTRETIEEYRKLKQSIITETVTKGLNPDAEMKDSGIPWIGKIPVEWKICKVKLCYSIISGSGFADSLQGKESGELPVCKASDISNAGHNLNSAANYLSRAEASVNGFSIIPIGSVLFPKIGEAMRKNSRTISRVPCCLDNNCQAAVPQNIDTEYGYYVLFSVDMTWFDNNGTVPCINNSKFKNAFLPIPPPLEQRRIADCLDAKCAELDSIIEKKEQLIEELGSYKKSLIYEYVTGKKEVQT